MSASARLNPIPANGWIEWFESPARMSPGLPMLLVTDGLRSQILFSEHNVIFLKLSPSAFMIFLLNSSSDRLNIFADFVLLNDHTSAAS